MCKYATHMLLLFLLNAALGLVMAFGCGGTGSGTEGEEGTVYGSSVNQSFEVTQPACDGATTVSASSGSFSVVSKTGIVDPCAQAIAAPTIATATLPSDMTLNSTGETNVTSGASAYTVTVGDRSFSTSDVTSVTLTVPYTSTAPTAAGLNDSLHVLLRIKSADDNSVVDVAGTISGSNLIVTVPGLPSSFTVAVIYNPNMAEVSATAAAASASAQPSAGKATSTSWATKQWCVVYDPAATEVINEAKTYYGITTTPTGAQISSMVQAAVADNSVLAQNAFQNDGMRQPNIYVGTSATDPCSALGTTSRFMIHFMYLASGSKFSPEDANEVISPQGNRYGRLYVNVSSTNRAATHALGTVYAGIAHEMHHAIQDGYDWKWMQTTYGLAEGPAASYGITLDGKKQNLLSGIKVRDISSEAYKFSYYLLQQTRDRTTKYVDASAYSNQDFFAYVARKYWSEGFCSTALCFTPTIYNQVKSDIAAETTPWPAYTLLWGSLNTFFQANVSGCSSGQCTLKDIYLDFMRQRVMEHNSESKLGRSGETTTGFASDLFASSSTAAQNALVTYSIDPTNVSSRTDTFSGIAPFSARAIWIKPSTTVAAGSSGATIKVTLTPLSGSLGTTFDGAAYKNGTYQALEQEMTFAGFGTSMSDAIVILLAHTAIEGTTAAIKYTIAGDSVSATEAGGATTANSSFTISAWTVTGQPQMTPRSVILMPDITGAGFLQPQIASGEFTDQQLATKPYISIQFRLAQISGAGTYAIGTSDTAPLILVYGDLSVPIGFEALTGTATFTAFGSAAGDHITGSLTANMIDTGDPNKSAKGSFSADFDLVVGSFNNL